MVMPRPVASNTAVGSMIGLAKLQPERGVWQTIAPIPTPGRDEVLIRVQKTAICGTDVHIYNWDEWAARTIPVPMIFGHEFAGEIVEVGQAVTRPLYVGQRVSGEGHIIDINSEAARTGQFHLDPNTRGIGVNRQGAFAEYLCLPAFNVVPLPDEVSLEIGALLDPFGNAMHTAQQFDLLGQNVLVTGAGPIGIMAAAIARKAGARSVVITDINPYRLELASRIADVRPVNIGHEDLKTVMDREGITYGFDLALEISGAGSAILQAVDSLKMGGGLAMLGIPAQAQPVNWSDIILKAITIKGVYGRQMFTTWNKMFGLIRSGLNLEPLITHRLDCCDFQTGFAAACSGEAGKVILNW